MTPQGVHFTNTGCAIPCSAMSPMLKLVKTGCDFGWEIECTKHTLHPWLANARQRIPVSQYLSYDLRLLDVKSQQILLWSGIHLPVYLLSPIVSYLSSSSLYNYSYPPPPPPLLL